MRASRFLLGVALILGYIYVAFVHNPLFNDRFSAIGGFWKRDSIASQDKYYKNLCPAYAKASFIDRTFDPHLIKLSWCSDYTDLLEAQGLLG